jgi:hypothetical protein
VGDAGQDDKRHEAHADRAGHEEVPYTAERSRRPESADLAIRHPVRSPRQTRPTVQVLEFAAAALQAGLVLGLLFLFPGAALGRFVVPTASTPLARAARAAGVSVLVTSAGCTVLAWLDLLLAPIVLALLVGLSVVPLLPAALRVLRAGDLRTGRRLPRGRWAATRAVRWWLGGAAAAGLAGVLVIGPTRAEVGPDLLPFTSTVWYYAQLAAATAAGGGFPDALPEWGALRPFQTDYLPVTAHTAAGIQLLPGELLVKLELYRLALLVLAILFGTALFRRWTSTWIALLGAILLVATVRFDAKFLSYKPETFGIVVALFGLWLADRALVERSRRLAIGTVLVAMLLFLSHAEVFLVFAPAVAGLAVARTVVGQGRSRLGLRRPARAIGNAAFVVVILVAGVIGGSLANAAMTGELRILGYVARDLPATGVGASPELIAPSGWRFSGDPTWDFYVASVAPAQLGLPAPERFWDSRLLPRAILHVWPGLDGRQFVLLSVLAGFVVVPYLAWPVLDARRRRALVTWGLFGIGLLAGSMILFLLADTYVPARVGPRRLMPFELFLPVVSGIVILWGVDRLLAPGWRALFPRRGAMVAAGAALALLAAGAVAPAPPGPVAEDREPGLTTEGFGAYRWIAANTPPDARILANAYTDGSLSALSERVGIVDGRAVYLEDPEFLAESTRLVLGARVVFAEPDSEAARRFVEREDVDYLLATGPDGTGNDLGGYDPFATNVAALRASGRYTLVQAFGDERLLLFRVVR